MPEHTSNGMQCHEFEVVLSDVLDGILAGPELDRFQAHARTCSACGPLLAEAEAGRHWLQELTEVEPPAGLVTNILASTTGIDTQRLELSASAEQPRVSWLEHVQAWISGTMLPVWEVVRQPRFAMSFGMAFFALSVGLTVAGVKPADLRQVSLRPAAIRHAYYNTQARVVRYYDNIRLVYELQSRVQQFKRNVAPASTTPAKPRERKNDTSKEPEQKQERNYSQTENRYILARAPLGPSVHDLPVVSVTTYRRFV
jgi:hypothetical protein